MSLYLYISIYLSIYICLSISLYISISIKRSQVKTDRVTPSVTSPQECSVNLLMFCMDKTVKKEDKGNVQ